GCGSSTAPSSSYAGQWSGTTTQGAAISFAISPDEKVTTISIGYNFAACSGTQTFSNLSLAIAPNVICSPGPCPPSLTSFREIEFESGNIVSGPSTSVAGVFLANATVQGTATFRNYPGCEDVVGTASWTAVKR